MVWIALHVNYLRSHVFRAIAYGVNNHAAANGTVRTRRTRLAGSRDLQGAKLRVGGLQIKSKNRSGDTTSGC
jgi:hypothetical protein